MKVDTRTITTSAPVEEVLAELCQILANLGRNDGLGSASVYDSAQVICLPASATDNLSAVEWLHAQQHAGDGW